MNEQMVSEPSGIACRLGNPWPSQVLILIHDGRREESREESGGFPQSVSLPPHPNILTAVS